MIVTTVVRLHFEVTLRIKHLEVAEGSCHISAYSIMSLRNLTVCGRLTFGIPTVRNRERGVLIMPVANMEVKLTRK